MPTPDYLLVVDLETTGHEDERDYRASVLEVGAVLVDASSPDLPAKGRANLLIAPAGGVAERDTLWAEMPQVVRDMHLNSGLWHEVTTSDQAWPLAEADDALAAWLDDQIGPDAKVAFAGCGIGHYDDRWLRWHLPKFRRRGTYWNVDASSVRRALELAGRDDLVDLPRDVEAKPHRALADALLHVNELRQYLYLLAQVPSLGELADRAEAAASV